MATTPDIETFVVGLLVALDGAVFVSTPVADRTLLAGPVRSQERVGQTMTFVQASGGRNEHHSDGQLPGYSVSVTTRFKRDEYENARVRATRAHDLLHLCGRRTVGSVTCIDIKATQAAPSYIGPGDDDAEYFVEDFVVEVEL